MEIYVKKKIYTHKWQSLAQIKKKVIYHTCSNGSLLTSPCYIIFETALKTLWANHSKKKRKHVMPYILPNARVESNSSYLRYNVRATILTI